MKTNPDEPHVDETDAWLAAIRDAHLNGFELNGLLHGAHGDGSLRARSHLRQCTQCREMLACRIEDGAIMETGATLDAAIGRFLRHSDPVVRAAATRAVVTMAAEAPHSVETLTQLLADEDELVRHDAVVAMSRTVRSERLLEALRNSIVDSATSVARVAARELRRQGQAGLDVLAQVWSPLMSGLVPGLAGSGADPKLPKRYAGPLLRVRKESDDRTLFVTLDQHNPELAGLSVVFLAAGREVGRSRFEPVPARADAPEKEIGWVRATVSIDVTTRRDIPTAAELTLRFETTDAG